MRHFPKLLKLLFATGLLFSLLCQAQATPTTANSSQNTKTTATASDQPPQRECGNFLKELGKQHKHLEFVDCKLSNTGQIRLLTSRYRVPGKHAAEVETYLVRTAKMPRLIFNCCGWESRDPYGTRNVRINGQYSDSSKKFWYDVSMSSGEVRRIPRAQWYKQDFFYVDVEYSLDYP